MSTKVDIGYLGLGDMVFYKGQKGYVEKCTEKPSVTIRFEDGKRKVFTEANQGDLS